LQERRTSLATKLGFLNENGLKEVASVIDSKLRKEFAPFRFDIIDDEICIEGRKAVPLVADSIFKLLILFGIVHKCLDKLDREKGMNRRKFK
jgi:hypothetical protein